jgi:DNA-binding NtrC family response regulator
MVVLCVVIVLLGFGAGDLGACGDKFLRLGRSARFRGYAAVHPATILIYSPVNATPAGIRELEALLKRAGHSPRAVENGAPLTQTFAASSYDLVIADYKDAGRIKDEIKDLPSKPDVLPILYKPSQAVAAEAEREYHFVLKPHAMNKVQALAEIDHLMDLRQKGNAAAAR